MHQTYGIVRVAICFLAKFGLFYFFVTSVFMFASMYIFVAYFTNVISDADNAATSSSKPVAPENERFERPALENHLRLTSNMKYKQTPWNALLPDTLGHYGRDLMTLVTQTSIVPACTHTAFLTVFITSAPRNFKARSAIRQTWCSDDMTAYRLTTNNTSSYTKPADRHRPVRCVFLLGKTLSKRIQENVELESRRYSDILQGTYLDTYRNLTLKVLNGLNWDQEHCPSTYVLKTDDDCFVNVPVLMKTLEDQQASSQEALYVGHVMTSEGQRQVIRNKYSKWEVSRDDFAPEIYPPYVSGSGYLLSRDLVEIIVTLYSTIYLIPIEDAFVGILLSTVGISPVKSTRFSVHKIPQMQMCNYMYFIVIHGVEPTEQEEYKKQSFQSYSQCRQKSSQFDWN